MRSLVCAQCHVEYYFKGKGNYLTFPWDKGTTPEKIEEYFDEGRTFADFTNAVSKTRNHQDPPSRLRALQHGHPRLSQRGLRRLPHALSHGRRREVHRPPPAKPAAQHRQFVRRLPPLERAGDSHAAWSRSRTRSARPAAGRKTPWPRPIWTWPRRWRPGRRTTNWPRPAEQIRHAQLRWDYIAAIQRHGFSFARRGLADPRRGGRSGRPGAIGLCPHPRPARLHAAGCVSGLQHEGEGPGAGQTVCVGEAAEVVIRGREKRPRVDCSKQGGPSLAGPTNTPIVPSFSGSFVRKLLPHPLPKTSNQRQLANSSDLASQFFHLFQRKPRKCEA